MHIGKGSGFAGLTGREINTPRSGKSTLVNLPNAAITLGLKRCRPSLSRNPFTNSVNIN